MLVFRSHLLNKHSLNSSNFWWLPSHLNSHILSDQQTSLHHQRHAISNINQQSAKHTLFTTHVLTILNNEIRNVLKMCFFLTCVHSSKLGGSKTSAAAGVQCMMHSLKTILRELVQEFRQCHLLKPTLQESTAAVMNGKPFTAEKYSEMAHKAHASGTLFAAGKMA